MVTCKMAASVTRTTLRTTSPVPADSQRCIVISFILGVWFVNAPAEVTKEEGRTGFLHLPFAGPALIFYRDKDLAVPFPRRP